MTDRTRKHDGNALSGLLIDLSGVVYQGKSAVAGSPEAIRRLRDAGMPLRFLTNTTSQPLSGILEQLSGIGISASHEEIFTPAKAARSFLVENGLEPHFLVAPALLEDFRDLPGGQTPAVVVGDAGEGFTYARLNDAFRRIDGGATLIALAKNRQFIGRDGRPTLDVGAFVAALEYATRKPAVVLGKPAAGFFRLAASDMGLPPDQVGMIGDDAEFDVAAAIEAGLAGYLVRTGKWTPDSQDGLELQPDHVFDDLRAAVRFALGEPRDRSENS